MSPDASNITAARSWRDIPQPLKPRAMSRGGKWRLARQSLRHAAVAGLVAVLAWCGWVVASSLRESSPHMPAAAKSVPVRAPELKTGRNGVLNDAWLARTLALRPHVSLMELDLGQLRARILADPQVLTANLTRQFPDRLMVQVTERTPLARIRVQQAAGPEDLLVARDGVIFAGTGFAPEMIESLPWLNGVALIPEGRGFRPLPNMDVVAQFLTGAQVSAEHLYGNWQVVSLARIESDHEIEVTTKDSTTVIFDSRGSFFTQLANLDYMMERLARLPRARARIDLSLGREVPVMIEPLPSDEAKPARPAPGATAFLPAFTNFQSTIKREL